MSENPGEDEILKSIFERSDFEISKREDTIRSLEEQLQKLKDKDIPYIQITKEAVNQYPSVKELYIASGANVTVDGYSQKNGLLVIAKTAAPLTAEQKTRITDWLRIRTNTTEVTFYEFAAEKTQE